MAEPNDMLVFAAVVREGGFTAAARSLAITKQSVSDRVARLERTLGVRLLQRTTRQVRPTDAGAAYAARCAELGTLIERADLEAQGISEEPAGTLRVSAPVVFGRRVLGAVVGRLLERHPRLSVDLVLDDRRVRLLDEGFDAAIRVGPLEDSSLQVRRVAWVRLCVVASRALARTSRIRTPADLAAAPCIVSRSGETWVLGGQKVRVRPRLCVNDLEAVYDAVVRGAGFARLPEPICAEGIASGEVVEVLGKSAPPSAPVHVVTAPGRHASAKIAAFVEELVAVARTLPGTPPGTGR